MALFIDFNDSGLIIYTSHRQIHELSVKNIEELKEKVENKFEITENVKDIQDLKNIMENNKNKHIFGVYFQNKYLILKLKDEIKPEEFIPSNQSKEWKNLNLPILHEILLKGCLDVKTKDITFIKDVKNGIENVNKNEKIKALFVVNPTTLEEVHEITKLGEIMPQKSTYFYPKPLSGLIIHRHIDRIE